MIKAKLLLASLASVLALTGCASTDRSGADGNYVTPIGNSPVTPNPTPYSEALVCLANYARSHNLRSPRVAVGRLSDYTGRASLEGGAAITQGASLMAISAFSKAGIRLVERFDTSISELELRYANNSLIGNDDAIAGRRAAGRTGTGSSARTGRRSGPGLGLLPTGNTIGAFPLRRRRDGLAKRAGRGQNGHDYCKGDRDPAGFHCLTSFKTQFSPGHVQWACQWASGAIRVRLLGETIC